MPRKIASSKKSEISEKSEESVKPSINREPQTMDELMKVYGAGFKVPKRGEFTEGIITRVTPKEIRIDVGSKIEGIVMDKELALFKDLINQFKPGDHARVYVVSSENKQGQLILSIRKYAMEMKWNKFKDAMEHDQPVTVRTIEFNKGGCICHAEGLQGFLPSSQMDPSRMSRTQDMINRLIQVKVIEVNQRENRLVFSERVFLQEENSKKSEDLKKLIVVGQEYSADVVGITNFGAFVKVHLPIVEDDGKSEMLRQAQHPERSRGTNSNDQNSKQDVEKKKKVKGPVKETIIEGLVHISEISWDKVDDINQYLKVGDKIKVLILGVDDKTAKFNCSIKQLKADPWIKATAAFKIDQKVEGQVSRISEYGIFVSLPGGVEGLIHISKVPPAKQFNIGEKVKCQIESIESTRRKISLTPVISGKFIGYR